MMIFVRSLLLLTLSFSLGFSLSLPNVQRDFADPADSKPRMNEKSTPQNTTMTPLWILGKTAKTGQEGAGSSKEVAGKPFDEIGSNDNDTYIILPENGTAMEVLCGHLEIDPSDCTCKKIEEIIPGYCEPEELPCQVDSSDIAEKSLIVFISILGIIGNILVLIVRVRNWKKSLHYRLISGLALADLTFCCMFLFISIPAIWLCRWPLGKFLCTLLRTILFMSSNVDLGFILIIAIERYIGIVHPFQGGASACKIYCMVGINLLASFLAGFPFFFIFKVDSSGKCTEDWSMFLSNASYVYGWVSNIFLFLIPIIITALLYWRGLKTLKSTLFRQEMMLTLDEASRKNLVSENHRILRIISTILLAFLLLVGPNHVAWFLSDNFTLAGGSRLVFFKISSVAYAIHTSINPIIYSIIDRKFRRNVYYMLRKGRRRKSFTTTATAVHFSPVHTQVMIENGNGSLGSAVGSSRPNSRTSIRNGEQPLELTEQPV
eukprot:TCONS_00064614-protein